MFLIAVTVRLILTNPVMERPVLANIKLVSLGDNTYDSRLSDQLVFKSGDAAELSAKAADALGEGLMLLAEQRGYLISTSDPFEHPDVIYQLTAEGNALATSHPAVLRESIRVLNLAMNAKVDK